MKLNKNELVRKILTMEQGHTKDDKKKQQAEAAKLEVRNREIEKLLMKLYEDRLSGSLNEHMFATLSSKYQAEQAANADRISEIASLSKPVQDEAANTKKWITAIDSISYPTELTRELILSLIDKIVVFEAIGPKGSRKKTQVVEIYWKFVGAIEGL